MGWLGGKGGGWQRVRRSNRRERRGAGCRRGSKDEENTRRRRVELEMCALGIVPHGREISEGDPEAVGDVDAVVRATSCVPCDVFGLRESGPHIMRHRRGIALPLRSTVSDVISISARWAAVRAGPMVHSWRRFVISLGPRVLWQCGPPRGRSATERNKPVWFHASFDFLAYMCVLRTTTFHSP